MRLMRGYSHLRGLLGFGNRKTAQNSGEKRKIGKTEKPKIQGFLRLQSILGIEMTQKFNKTEKPMKITFQKKNGTGFQLNS